MVDPKSSHAAFLHKNGMRNTPQIKALRSKHGIVGYAIYFMLLEVLYSDYYYKIPYTDLKLLSGDFCFPAPEIRLIVDYCCSLDLLQIVDGFIMCKSLKAV